MGKDSYWIVNFMVLLLQDVVGLLVGYLVSVYWLQDTVGCVKGSLSELGFVMGC